MNSETAHNRWLSIDPSLSFEAECLSDMLRRWERWRGERPMPERADFGPADLRGHLGWVVLIDVEPAPLRFRYRLIGSEVTQAVGRDSTGRYLDDLYRPEIYETAITSFREILACRRPMRAFGTLRHAEKGYVPFEAIDMPFANGSGEVGLIMTRNHLPGRAADPPSPQTSTKSEQ